MLNEETFRFFGRGGLLRKWMLNDFNLLSAMNTHMRSAKSFTKD